MTKYRITCPFGIPDYYSMRKAVFGDAQPCFEEFTPGGSVITIGFNAPQTPADLGPLVKVEEVPSGTQTSP